MECWTHSIGVQWHRVWNSSACCLWSRNGRHGQAPNCAISFNDCFLLKNSLWNGIIAINPPFGDSSYVLTPPIELVIWFRAFFIVGSPTSRNLQLCHLISRLCQGSLQSADTSADPPGAQTPPAPLPVPPPACQAQQGGRKDFYSELQFIKALAHGEAKLETATKIISWLRKPDASW